MHRFCEILGMYLASVVFCLPFAGIAWAIEPGPVPALFMIVTAPLFLTAWIAHLDGCGFLDD